jgi:hypothetical protein
MFISTPYTRGIAEDKWGEYINYTQIIRSIEIDNNKLKKKEKKLS